MRKLLSPTGQPMAIRAVWPNVGVEVWYRAQLIALIEASARSLVSTIARAWNDDAVGHITVADEAIRAAGVWFIASKGRELAHLLLHRTDGAGWAFPGGHIEDGETAWEAARREVMEEIGYEIPEAGKLNQGGGELTHYGAVRFITYKRHVSATFTPILRTDEHDEYRWCNLDDALELDLHPGVRELLEGPAVIGDAHTSRAPPTRQLPKRLQVALRKWGTDTIRRFDDMSLKIANDFAERNQQATDVAMRAQLKRSGFSVSFRPTAQSVEAFRETVKWNVDLIRSIPRKYHDKVIQRVRKAVEAGSDLHTLTKELRTVHQITQRRAALIARDQNAKAKANIEQARRLELGITRARWRHSHAGEEPRITHVAASEQGITYDIRKGWYDPDPSVRKHIHPGELIECRCSSDAIIEGFLS